MAMGSSGGGEGLSSEINVTPLIDVLLVLLIIFMITQPLSRKAFDVQTPKPQKGAKDKPSSQIVLELKIDGSYAINGQPYTLNQLDQAFHQIYDPRPAKLLFIKAAPDAVNFFVLSRGTPTSVDVALTPHVPLPDLSGLRRIAIELPPLDLPRPSLPLPVMPVSGGTGGAEGARAGGGPATGTSGGAGAVAGPGTGDEGGYILHAAPRTAILPPLAQVPGSVGGRTLEDVVIVPLRIGN